jgi:hypothetical protein
LDTYQCVLCEKMCTGDEPSGRVAPWPVCKTCTLTLIGVWFPGLTFGQLEEAEVRWAEMKRTESWRTPSTNPKGG